MFAEKHNLSIVEIETVLKNAPTPLLAVDEHHRLLWFNDKAACSTGAPTGCNLRLHYGNILGCRYVETSFVGNGLGEACQHCELRQTIENTLHTRNGVGLKQLTLTDRNGKPHTLEVSTCLISTGKGPAVVVAFEDRTQLEINATLAAENQHLMAAIETAGAICHDLSQPLMTISGYIQLMEIEAEKNSSRLARLQKIHAQVLKMAALTQKIMDLRNMRLPPGKSYRKTTATVSI